MVAEWAAQFKSDMRKMLDDVVNADPEADETPPWYFAMYDVINLIWRVGAAHDALPPRVGHLERREPRWAALPRRAPFGVDRHAEPVAALAEGLRQDALRSRNVVKPKPTPVPLAEFLKSGGEQPTPKAWGKGFVGHAPGLATKLVELLRD